MDKKTNSGLMLLGGIVAAAAGAYFVYGNKAAEVKIKKIKGWALKAKGEVVEKLEKLKDVNEDMYHSTIDAVMKKYENVKNVDVSELESVSKELKSHWKNIKRELAGSVKKVEKSATSVVKKVKNAVQK
jgi:hypothetical protein